MPSVRDDVSVDATPSGSRDRISLLLEQVTRSVHALCFADGLHPVQWSALRYFALADERDRTVSALAVHLGVTQPPASRTVSALIQRGLLSTELTKSDRRVKLISLTDDGYAVLSRDPLQRLDDVMSTVIPTHPSTEIVLRSLSDELRRKLREARVTVSVES